MRRIVFMERHELGPRIYLLGSCIHEFQAGLTVLARSSWGRACPAFGGRVSVSSFATPSSRPVPAGERPA
jgi:hypothetical protein